MESMISLLAVGEPWYSGILASLNGFCVYVIGLIYKAAAYFLRIFLVLANGKLVDSENYETLINNFYLIIGIGMLFVLAFALLRNMINPDDKKGTSTVKKVVLNLVTSTMIMALLPTIFAFAFDFQNSVLIRQNTIGRFFGYGGGNGVDVAIDQGANQLANGVFTAFFNADQGFCEDLTLQECQAQIETDDGEASLDEVINEVNVTGKFGMYADFKDSIGSSIEHNILLNLIAGLLLIYVTVSFCFDMAIRYIKLIFYQIIAPIPVFCRVIPEGKLSSIFNQWVKVTLACYLEVFIRILTFYFCIYLYNSLFGSNGYGASWDFLSGTSYNIMFFVKAFIIMGIVIFMKQAPKLISEITGIDSGNMKLGIKDKLKDGGFFATGAALGAGATAITRNANHAWTNIKNAKGTGERAKAIAAGFGSVFAGGISGAFRGGKSGMAAKSFTDMRNAAGRGAKGATDARNKREAYRIQHNGENLAKAKWNDYIQNAKEWAEGGFEAEEAKLKAYNELLATQDAAKNAAEKILDKHSTKPAFMVMPSAFKGINNPNLESEFRNFFRGQNLATIENTINGMKNEKMEKRKYFSTILNREVEETDAEFEKRIRDHNAKVSAYEAMYQQTRKESIKNLQSMVFDPATYTQPQYNLGEKDVLGIAAELTKARDQLNAMGMGDKLDLSSAFGPGTGVGYDFDSVAEGIEIDRNKLSAEVARKKATRDARHQNDNH